MSIRNPKLKKINTVGNRDPTYPQFFEIDRHPLIDTVNGRIFVYKVDTSVEASKARYELGQSRKIRSEQKTQKNWQVSLSWHMIGRRLNLSIKGLHRFRLGDIWIIRDVNSNNTEYDIVGGWITDEWVTYKHVDARSPPPYFRHALHHLHMLSLIGNMNRDVQAQHGHVSLRACIRIWAGHVVA